MLQLLPTLLLLLMQGPMSPHTASDRWDMALLRMAACSVTPSASEERAIDEDESDDLRLQILSLLCAFDGPLTDSTSTATLPDRPTRTDLSVANSPLPRWPDHGFGGFTRDGPAA